MNHASTIPSTAAARRTHAGAGKYLTFTLGPEEYGIPILKVCEIIRALHVTPVPGAAAHVGGVINLRGQVIAVTDLRAVFRMNAAERSERTCIIIVEVTRDSRKVRTGILVDSVREVLNIPASDVEEAPTLGASAPPDYVLGIARSGDSVKILVDVDPLLGSEAL